MALTLTAVVPTYRRPTLLERALRSIAAQTCTATEVIVVDDTQGGPTEATREAVGRSGVSAARVVANMRQCGASGARNTGAELASGELLAFLDDDDEWLPSYLQEALTRFESHGVDLLCTDFLFAYDDGTERPGKTAPDFLAPQLFFARNPGLVGSNVIIRRRLYRDMGGFDELLPARNDQDFGLRLSLRAGVIYHRVDLPLVRLHHHTGPRICMPQSEGMRAGTRRFYELHAHRVTPAQRAEFRRNVRRLWGIDERGRTI